MLYIRNFTTTAIVIISIDCITTDDYCAIGELTFRYTTTTHTHTRKEDFISLLPKVKIYPKYRIFDRFFMSVFDNNCYHLGKSAE